MKNVHHCRLFKTQINFLQKIQTFKKFLSKLLILFSAIFRTEHDYMSTLHVSMCNILWDQ